MKVRLRSALALSLACVVPVRALANHDTPQAPDASSAVLSTKVPGLFPDERLLVMEIDGKKTSHSIWLSKHAFPTVVRLAPGRHALRLMALEGKAQLQRRASMTLWFDAEAGKAYVARETYVTGGSIRVQIEEAGSGRLVGGLGDGSLEGAATSAAPSDAAAPSVAQAPAPTQWKRKTNQVLPQADAQSAVLVSDPGDSSIYRDQPRVQIWRLDGTKQYHPSSLYQAFRLAPGEHRLSVSYSNGGASVGAMLVFNAEAGKSYQVRHSVDGYGVRLWIVDAATMQEVSHPLSR